MARCVAAHPLCCDAMRVREFGTSGSVTGEDARFDVWTSSDASVSVSRVPSSPASCKAAACCNPARNVRVQLHQLTQAFTAGPCQEAHCMPGIPRWHGRRRVEAGLVFRGIAQRGMEGEAPVAVRMWEGCGPAFSGADATAVVRAHRPVSGSRHCSERPHQQPMNWGFETSWVHGRSERRRGSGRHCRSCTTSPCVRACVRARPFMEAPRGRVGELLHVAFSHGARRSMRPCRARARATCPASMRVRACDCQCLGA